MLVEGVLRDNVLVPSKIASTFGFVLEMEADSSNLNDNSKNDWQFKNFVISIWKNLLIINKKRNESEFH